MAGRGIRTTSFEGLENLPILRYCSHGPGYSDERTDFVRVQDLWESADFILFSGRSANDSEPVLILPPASERPSPATIRGLEYLHSVRHKLDSAWFDPISALPGSAPSAGRPRPSIPDSGKQFVFLTAALALLLPTQALARPKRPASQHVSFCLSA